MRLSTADLMTAADELLPMMTTVVGVLVPGAAPLLSIGAKIVQGVAAAVPEAEALYARIQSGDVPTQAELDAYATAEDGAYAALMAKLATA
jgi:hypothetical protein